MIELIRALAVLCEPPSPTQPALAELLELPWVATGEPYAELFLFQLYPYASVYLGGEGKVGGPAGERIAGFWRALGYTPPPEPDHLAALLGLYAALSERERREPAPARRLLLRQSRRALLHEHLSSWIDPYLDKLAELAPPHYAAWGALLGATLRAEAARLEASATLATALREAPMLAPPRSVGGAAFLDQLLAPCRTGVIIVRHDLVRIARQLGLGLRIAERRYVLEALLTADPAGTLRALAADATLWSARHGPGFWRERAALSASILAQAADEVAAGDLV